MILLFCKNTIYNSGSFETVCFNKLTTPQLNLIFSPSNHDLTTFPEHFVGKEGFVQWVVFDKGGVVSWKYTKIARMCVYLNFYV